MERGPVQGTVWVEPGRLLAGPYPGNEVGWLAEAGVDVVLDLTSPRDGLDPYAARLAPEQRVVRRPVTDFEAPTATAMR